MQIRAILADDSIIFRKGMRQLIAEIPIINIVAEANSLPRTLTLAAELKPDILFLEINLCQNPISDFLKDLEKNTSNIKVFIISECNCGLLVYYAIKSGVDAFVKKTITSSQFVNAVQKVLAGEKYFENDIWDEYKKNLPNFSNSILSEKEQVVLRYICKGRSNEQIADILFLSEKTIGTHKRNIMSKLKIKKTSDLIIWGIDMGYKY
jgi:DNA-binding NarL/FixJ family response regulator